MSKPISGHFSGTSGSKNAHENKSQQSIKRDIIIPKGLDTRNSRR